VYPEGPANTSSARWWACALFGLPFGFILNIFSFLPGTDREWSFYVI
jgi:hypothetical protein